MLKNMTIIKIKKASGKEVNFEAKEGYSLLAQMEEQGIKVKYGCRAGKCKLCTCKISK